MIVVTEEDIARAARRVGVTAEWLRLALTRPDCEICNGSGREPREDKPGDSGVATPWHRPYRPCPACAGLGVLA